MQYYYSRVHHKVDEYYYPVLLHIYSHTVLQYYEYLGQQTNSINVIYPSS